MAELFEKFEVNREARWKVLTKLVGASLVLHLSLLWAAVYVPVFRDTLNIVALVAGTKFVDKPYDPTRIKDDVQWLQTEKFHYPEGYFAPDGRLGVELPPENMLSGNFPGFEPKIISQASKEVEPAPSPSPSPDASPSPSASAIAAETGNPANPNPSSSPLTPEEAQKQLEKTAEENKLALPTDNEINRKPLKDLLANVNELKNQGKLDLEKPFKIVIQAKLDDKGKLVDPRLVEKEGDDVLQDLFKQMVSALNDSGLMIFLQPISADNPGATVRITIVQGEQKVLASVESEMSSSPSAEKLARGFNGMLAAGAWSRAGKDEAELMKNSNAKPDGKKVVVSFAMPRQSIIDMLKKQLEQPGV